jgi:hypothetical protein
MLMGRTQTIGCERTHLRTRMKASFLHHLAFSPEISLRSSCSCLQDRSEASQSRGCGACAGGTTHHLVRHCCRLRL